jgi:uncharacterized OsmC-like protein
MDSKELKTLQAPLKEKYKQNPEAAVITLKAKGKISDGITCNIETGKAFRAAGLHAATGGNGLHVCSGDMLLEALVACAGVTLNAVATSIGVNLVDAEVFAEGDIDFRGTLAVSKEVPVGFKNIRLKFNLKADASEEQINSLIKLTERYCVVYQTLKNSPDMNTAYEMTIL